MRYEILINVEWVRGERPPFVTYNEGDLLVRTYEGEQGSRGDPVVALEQIFARHNADDRPDGNVGPSLSIGDVVVLGDQAHAVHFIGWKNVPVPTNISDKTWVEITKDVPR